MPEADQVTLPTDWTFIQRAPENAAGARDHLQRLIEIRRKALTVGGTVSCDAIWGLYLMAVIVAT